MTIVTNSIAFFISILLGRGSAILVFICNIHIYLILSVRQNVFAYTNMQQHQMGYAKEEPECRNG